jgi:cytochrome c peroxidase
MSVGKAWLAAVVLVAAIVAGVGLTYLDRPELTAGFDSTSALELPSASAEPITPLPRSIAVDARKVDLGRRLFADPRLSADGTISCATCHDLNTGGVDRRVHSRGIGGQQGTINAPTVFNTAFNFRQFWDGRAETLDDQVNGPLLNPVEMGSTWTHVIAMLSADPDYRAAFAAIYPDGIVAANVRDAISSFEHSLITPDSRFDRYLRGERGALSAKEMAGYRLFKQIGCTSCHQGINVGGNMYQKLGIMADYFAARGNVKPTDLGLYNLTKRPRDLHFFKVPSLRNVALTPPYLHDGSVATLADAVRVMGRYQLGTELDDADVDKIVAFLDTLTGEYQGKPLR